MKTVRLVCPNCSSPDFEPTPLDPNRCRCRHCGNYFAISQAKSEGSAQPGPAMPGAPKTASAGMGVVLIAFAVTALVIGGAVVGLVLMRGASRPRHAYGGTSESIVPPIAIAPIKLETAEVEPEAAPAAEVRNVRHGEQSGYEVWIGEIVNTGEAAIDRPCARAVLKDAGGQVIGDERGYAHRAALGKGQSAPFRITGKKASYASVDVVLCELRPASRYGAGEVPAKVVEHKLQRADFGIQSVIGTVENDGEVPLKFVHLVLMGRDAAGTLVSVDDGFADAQVLAPGKRSPFKVSVGIFSTGTVARYDAYAVGMPGK